MLWFKLCIFILTAFKKLLFLKPLNKNVIKKILTDLDFLPFIITFSKSILFNSGNHLLAVLLDILLIISISNSVFS